ncbi:MAG: phosphoglucosamine mutase [Candidatus Bipolaricaulota bacterium]
MTPLFGTDGVRGVANADLTPELALAVARAAVAALLPSGGRVIVGRDSRTSGPMLEAALAAGFASSGVDVGLAGVIPTPAISFLIKDERADLGAVLSASHNPPEDNGIKLFDSAGRKLTVDQEAQVEALLSELLPPSRRVGTIEPIEAAASRYAAFLTGAIDGESVDLSGLTLVADCAYGATSLIAPRVFRHLGARVEELHAVPDGCRINVGCGSTHLGPLRQAVRDYHADLGVAFDGDGDRVLLVAPDGRTIDGDHVLGIVALHYARHGGLVPPAVVSTILANYGLESRLREEGIELVRTPVGDRNVAQAMMARAARLGGEPSGHIIFADHAPTGDGILTAVKLLEVAHEAGASFERLASQIPLYPQAQHNVPCSGLGSASASSVLFEEVEAEALGRLGGRGRVIIRRSGTQPVVRVFVEAEDAEQAEDACRSAAERLTRELQAFA